ncbi:3-phosphoshikimate 1-carboxyvinyltransferase [Sporolituus thermophilus]|uniref:3-phosphoshikimate 1-carboxyvinyltransferase n=1 Tax=Sporolituus thermophilus DSM 23256 TaxID=1123285 RepID=A0A1G7KJB3_9FIRM|nr:3-phosphoshikimate 1-carboxyvinyltransferase [Sporolituus thermophilus]SDF37050.1 3-phosphoshikimate 1-carboxyvinyltransferase [Sporolituus thermophilus DSM 23256]
MFVTKCNKGLRGTVTVPGDKSISHRAVMLGALAKGVTTIDGFLPGKDCLATIDCFRKLGVNICQTGSRVEVEGVGLRGLRAPQEALYVGNSGTTIRLLLGILAAQPFKAVVTGDESIRRRPMGRVVAPLRAMGARIDGEGDGNFAPLSVYPVNGLSGIAYSTPVASAQVKSALLLAGLYAQSATTVTEPAASRDHTERMLAYFGVDIRREGLSVQVRPASGLAARHVVVPGDISSAAFLMAAALIVPGSEVIIRDVGVNPTRTGIIDVFKDMGGDINLENLRDDCGEPVADVRVRHSRLRGTNIAGSIIPRLIDEIPVIAVVAAFAEGTTTIRDAAELKVKESDRIAAIVNGLRQMGGDATALPDGLRVQGGRPLKGAVIDSQGDHRIAMAFAIAGLMANGDTVIGNAECIDVSFPGFAARISALGACIAWTGESDKYIEYKNYG